MTFKIKANTEKIIETRVRLGLNMKAFAAKANVSRATLIAVEKELSPVTPKTAQIICETLGAEFDELFTIAVR